MCTYLKNMAGWKPKDLKNTSFANIQELFNNVMERVNTFVDMDTELVEGDKEKVAIDVIPLATKLPKKRYPLTPATITDMLNKKLQADHLNEIFKEGENLTQTFTRYKALMNELVNDGIKLSKLEINNGFISGLSKKWLSFCRTLINANHVRDYELASLFGKLKYKESLSDNIYDTEKEKYLSTTTPLSTAFFSNSVVQDFQDTKYNKVKALSLLSSGASTSKSTQVRNQVVLFEKKVPEMVNRLRSPSERLELIITEVVASSNQDDQNDQSVQNDKILNDDHAEHLNHTNDENIIENLTNTEDVQATEPPSSSTEDALASNTVLIIQTETPTTTPSLTTLAPQDRWFRDKHIELINIVDFQSDAEPKKVSEALNHPG
ncbi:hypothetical protein Tco_0698186 [Tanacetum coccineum]